MSTRIRISVIALAMSGVLIVSGGLGAGEPMPECTSESVDDIICSECYGPVPVGDTIWLFEKYKCADVGDETYDWVPMGQGGVGSTEALCETERSEDPVCNDDGGGGLPD